MKHCLYIHVIIDQNGGKGLEKRKMYIIKIILLKTKMAIYSVQSGILVQL